MIEQQLKAGLLSSPKKKKRLKIGEDSKGLYLYFESRPHDRFYISISKMSERKPLEILEAFEDMESNADAFREMAEEISEIFNKKSGKA